MSFPVLTLLTLIPLAGGLLLLPNWLAERRAWALALGFSALNLALALGLCAGFDGTTGRFEFVEKHEWIKALAVNYHLGVDGLGLIMVLLSALLVPLAVLASNNVTNRPRLYFALMLFLESGLIGTFTALNFFHWFLFWEISLIPAFFLIRFWGGAGAPAAALQFFVYTMVGSVGLLLAFVALYLAVGEFDFAKLAELARTGTLSLGLDRMVDGGMASSWAKWLVFAGAFLGFAVKVPLMPFHTWLPGTYSEAPLAVTMLLTGAMSKMGVYGFLRILLPIFPEQLRAAQSWLIALAVLTIVASAGAAFAQSNLRRTFAYSSINHLGYCLLGIFVLAGAGTDSARSAVLAGVLLQMFNHGLTAAALFWFLSLLERRAEGRHGLNDFGGLRQAMPVFSGLMGIAMFSSLGLPGLNGFVGEFLIFKGVFATHPWAAALATLGLLITAVFLLTVIQRVFNGPLPDVYSRVPDLSLGERVQLAPVIGLMFLLGIWPQILLGPLSGFIRLVGAGHA
jgi:NADH-quinone oxidoreductase subunit M